MQPDNSGKPMRVITGTIFLASLVCMATLVVAINSFRNIDPDNGQLLNDLTVGRIHLLFSKATWAEGLETRPSLLFFWVSGPLGITFVLALSAILYLRLRRHKRWILVGLPCLLLVPAFYAVGRIALHGNAEPTNAGPWLKWMLAGPLYALLAFSLFTLADFCAVAGTKVGREPLKQALA